jgi:hypothetical protein
VVAGVAGAKVADHRGRALAKGKARLGLAPERRPGVGARPARVLDPVVKALQVQLKRL